MNYMVCIAAFIILGLVGVFVAIISIFKKDFGRAYWKAMKKATGCVGKKVRLQKCDTNFKDDVKNTLLKKIILKHPKWVHPLSVLIEVLSVVFVIIFIWAVLTAVKSLLALWALGTCNVTKPSACSLGAEVCSLGDEDDSAGLLEQTGRWFTEWGDIFAAIPDRLKNWDAKEYLIEPTTFVDASIFDSDKSAPKDDAPYALDLLDPGCSACMMSFRNQLESGFFEAHKTALLLYPIKVDAENYKFKNSDLVARYFYAAAILDQEAEGPKHFGIQLIHKIFTGKTESGQLIQSYLASLEYDEAKQVLKSYLREFGATDQDLQKISKLEKSDAVKDILNKVENLAKNQIKITGIPTLIYDGKKHLGLYEAK